MPSNSVVNIITREILDKGVIPFARFMWLALYCPVCGYYEKEKDTVGARGDYYTNVSVGSLFGELLAFQFAEWLQPCVASHIERKMRAGEPDPPKIVEAGAHNGMLARDILKWLCEHRPELFQKLEYWIVEPSPRRQQWQQATLAEFAHKARWMAALSGPPNSAPVSPDGLSALSISGIIFSNELLDALPAHRLGWDAKAQAWFEWGVTLKNGQFVWKRMTCDESGAGIPGAGVRPPGHAQRTSSPDFEPANPWELPPKLLSVLPDGFTIEFCPDAEKWWLAAARALDCGRLLTIDYGLTGDEFFMPQRHEGTLRAYHRHRLSGDILAQPGEQDITAHVNFSSIQAAGESAGLQTEAFLAQAQFLSRIAARACGSAASFGSWTSGRKRQFQTLTHPEHLGRLFRALVQARNAS